MNVNLTHTESEEYFYNSLCNGLGYVTSGYGLELDYVSSDYQEAKTKLKETNEGICFEDVLMQILKDGKKLTLIDIEGEDEMTRSITLEDVHDRVPLTPIDFLMEMINEQDDANTADVIIQTVFYNEIIFG